MKMNCNVKKYGGESYPRENQLKFSDNCSSSIVVVVCLKDQPDAATALSRLSARTCASSTYFAVYSSFFADSTR